MWHEDSVTGSQRCNFTNHCLENQRKLEGKNTAFNPPPLWFSAPRVSARALVKERNITAGCLRSHCYSMNQRREASGGFCRLAVTLCLTQCGLCVPAGNRPCSHPCTASSLCLAFADLTTAHYLRGVLAHAPTRYFWPSAAQLPLGFCQSQRVLGPVTGPLVPQENVAIRARLRHNHGRVAFLLSIQ